jgi:catechol 2,3-dioxygenase-like lactoylglutathione lyase family enzyme
MLRSQRLIAFLPTTDRDRAKSFYEGVLGLPVMADDASALVLDANGIMVRLSEVKGLTPAAYTVLGWTVDDIHRFVTELGGKGVSFERFPWLPQDAEGICRFPDGAQVAWFKDPDGNLLSLTQFGS